MKKNDIYDVYKSIRKPMPPPTRVKDKRREKRQDVKREIQKDFWEYKKDR